MEQQIGKVNERDIEEDLKKKREFTLANHVVDEIKTYVRCSIHFINVMYKESFIDEDDLKVSLNEDLLKLLVNSIFSGQEIYRLLIFMYRVDSFDFDKSMRVKYANLRGVKTTDFAIDPYLSLADPMVVIKEANQRYGVDIKTRSELVQNPTVQKLDSEEIVNIEFKEYFRKHREDIIELPPEVQEILLKKARVRPYQKSVARFREVMTSPSLSPIEKLIGLQSLKVQI